MYGTAYALKPMQDLCNNRFLYGDRFLHCCMYNCYVDCHVKRLIRTEFKTNNKLGIRDGVVDVN